MDSGTTGRIKRRKAREAGRKKESDLPVYLDMGMHPCNPGIQGLREDDCRVEARVG